MKVAAILGPMQAGVAEKPDPRPKDDIAVVKIIAAPMCTEYYAFKKGDLGDCHGHEAVGEVVAVDKATRVKVGDRVIVQPQTACGECYVCQTGDFIHCWNNRDLLKETGSEAGRATMGQYILQAERWLTKIPEGMSYEHAGMALCGCGPTFGAMQLLKVDAFDTVLITGMGPVGLGGVINARYRGARVIGVESNPYRAALAKELGAEAIINPSDEDAIQQVLDLTNGIGADKSIDTSGTEAAKPFLMKTTRCKGGVAFVGWSGEVEVNSILGRGLSVYGAWHYNLNDAGRLLKMLSETGPQLDKLITHRFPLSKIQEAWEIQVSGNCGKVALYPWE
ncbi:MAG: zinc-binding dehydrogenase [Armatimonadetes bacterium]|nr:zinc-binding dehydrogenase [Armatimonadota bacterium]